MFDLSFVTGFKPAQFLNYEMSTPAFVDSAEKLSDTVTTKSTTDVKSASPRTETSSVNAYGISVLKGGSTLGSSFVDAVKDAYTNYVSYNYFGTILLLISTLYYASIVSGAGDRGNPFSVSHAVLKKTASEHSDTFVSSSAHLFSLLFGFASDRAEIVAPAFLFFAVYLGKPSSRNAILSSVLFFFCLLTKAPALQVILISQEFFLLTQLRDPQHKFMLVIAGVITVLGKEYLVAVSQGGAESLPKPAPVHTPGVAPVHPPTTPKPRG